MKLPVIKSLVSFIEQNDEDYIHETLEVLEHIGQAKGLKDEELEVIYELLSNMSGALEVQKLIKGGVGQIVSLNTFMQRVMGSIDK